MKFNKIVNVYNGYISVINKKGELIYKSTDKDNGTYQYKNMTKINDTFYTQKYMLENITHSFVLDKDIVDYIKVYISSKKLKDRTENKDLKNLFIYFTENKIQVLNTNGYILRGSEFMDNNNHFNNLEVCIPVTVFKEIPTEKSTFNINEKYIHIESNNGINHILNRGYERKQHSGAYSFAHDKITCSSYEYKVNDLLNLIDTNFIIEIEDGKLVAKNKTLSTELINDVKDLKFYEFRANKHLIKQLKLYKTIGSQFMMKIEDSGFIYSMIILKNNNNYYIETTNMNKGD